HLARLLDVERRDSFLHVARHDLLRSGWVWDPPDVRRDGGVLRRLGRTEDARGGLAKPSRGPGQGARGGVENLRRERLSGAPLAIGAGHARPRPIRGRACSRSSSWRLKPGRAYGPRPWGWTRRGARPPTPSLAPALPGPGRRPARRRSAPPRLPWRS